MLRFKHFYLSPEFIHSRGQPLELLEPLDPLEPLKPLKLPKPPKPLLPPSSHKIYNRQHNMFIALHLKQV